MKIASGSYMKGMTMKKIEKLTPEQEEALTAYHAECMSIGTSTDPADRPRAEAAIVKMYAHIGKTKPVFIWCDSPATCILARFVLQNLNTDSSLRSSLHSSLYSSLVSSLHSSLVSSLESSLDSSLRSSLHSSLRSSLHSSLVSSLRSSLRSSLHSSLYSSLVSSLHSSLVSSLESSLDSSLRSSLHSSLRSSLHSSLVSSLRSSLRSSLGSSLDSSLWGQQEQYWIGFYRFMELHLKIQYDKDKSEHLGWWQDIASSANWWFPYEGICFISERPIRCAIDEDRRLHHDSKTAMEFRDGWKIWAYHGVTVPEKLIEAPETLTIEDIRKEQNAEVRRVMIERMGWERFCSQAKMRVVHRDTLQSQFPALPISETVHAEMRMVTSYRAGEEVAELLESEEFKDFDDRPLKFVRVTDPSTGERYLIRVWPENQRVYEAIGRTFGLTEAQYKQSVLQHS